MTNEKEVSLQKVKERFVQEAIISQQVWLLAGSEKDQLAKLPHDDANWPQIMLFWSEQFLAVAYAKGAWSKYKPAAVPLNRFLIVWLPSLSPDLCHQGQLIGFNWSPDVFGSLIEPLELKQEIENRADELK